MCISMSIFSEYQTFSLLIYSYINTSRNWKNEKLCGNMSPTGRSIFSTKFQIFPIFTSVDITVYQYGEMFYISFIILRKKYKITSTEEQWGNFRVEIYRSSINMALGQ